MAIARTTSTSASAFSTAGPTGVKTAGSSYDLTGCTWAVVFACGTTGHTITNAYVDAGIHAATLIDQASDTAGEPADVSAYFLDITGLGLGLVTPRIISTPSVGNWSVVAVAGTGTAPEVYAAGLVKEQENQALTEENVNDGSPGTNSLRLAVVYYGAAGIHLLPGANTSIIGGANTAASSSWGTGYESVVGQGSRPVGFVNATADDVAALYFAIRETPAAAGPFFIPVIVGL